MPRRSTRSSSRAYIPQNTRSTHPDHLDRVATGPIVQPLTRREARMLEALSTTASPAPAVAPAPVRAEPALPSRRDRRALEKRSGRRTAPAGRTVPRKHLVLAVSGGLVVAAIAAGVSLSFGASSSTGTAVADAMEPTATALPSTAVKRVVLSSVSSTSGTVVGGTSVTLAGSHLDSIAAVRFGGVDGTVSVANAGTVTITAPPAPDQAEGTVDVAFYDASGTQITFDAVTDGAVSATTGGTQTASSGSTVSPSDAAVATATATPTAAPVVTTTATPDAEETATGPLAATKVVASALAFSYTPDPAIEAAKVAAAAASAAAVLKAQLVTAQLAYVDTYWSDYNSAQYGSISGNDCMNFTSQSLIARGWVMDSEWSYSSSGGYSSAWASSTAFAEYMAAHPERGTALSNTQRDQVKPGDVVQFDWDGSGDWDHTGVVTRVDGDTIYYSSHTSDNNGQSIDSASAARIGFWSIS